MATSKSNAWRVKLYELESNGTWVDLGVGHVSIQFVPQLQGPSLCLNSESEPEKYILVSKIQSDDLYERQGGTVSLFVSVSLCLSLWIFPHLMSLYYFCFDKTETIILWKEYEEPRSIDYALSFQEALGCQDIW